MNEKSILITGGTGFLGRALVSHWLNQGHRLTVLSRHAQAVGQRCGPGVNAINDLAQLPADSHFDAIVNLAGEPIFGGLWTASRKQILRDSRIRLTEQLVACIEGLAVKPEVLISGSAIGIYGDQGDAQLSENSPHKPDFAQQLCADWEQAARQAEKLGVRVCLIRTGLVLDNDGGLLQRMLPAFRLGLGGRLGSGRQWMSWIHRRDWVAIVDSLLNRPELHGPFNATAPNAVTNAEFSRCLAEQLQRPAWLPLPEAMLKLILGEMATLVLGSQHVVPERLLAEDFRFEFPTLAEALRQILPRQP